MLRLLAPLLALAVSLGHAAGHPVSVDDDAVREHMKTVRDRRTPFPGKVPAMEALLGLGVEAARQLGHELGDELSELRADYDRDAERFLERFSQAAVKTGEDRGRGGDEAEVDELRKTILRNARDESLTKEQVVAESDPALARLTELLHVGVQDVHERDPKLTELWFDLLTSLDRLTRVQEYFDRARDVLAADEDAARLLRQLPAIADASGERDRLRSERQRIALRSVPMSDNDRRILVENETTAAQLGPEEAAGILELNLIRIRCGIGALRIDTKLCETGRDHSKDMKELDFFSHTSPVEGKETFGQRASRFGTSAKAENIARGQKTGKAAIDGWWHSPGHHRNMMAPAVRVGLGHHESFWTQLFG